MLDSSKFLSLILSMLNQQAQAKTQAPAPLPVPATSQSHAIRESADEIIVALEAPGIQSRDDVYFSIGVTNLTVQGVRKITAGAHPAGTSGEVTSERFKKTFTLPFPVRPETATAFYSKGILEIRIKKLPERRWEKVYLQFL